MQISKKCLSLFLIALLNLNFLPDVIAESDLVYQIKEKILYEKAENALLYKHNNLYNKQENLRIVPGGQSIGIKVKSKGLMIVGLHKVDSIHGKISPAVEGNLQIGDSILTIDGNTVSRPDDIEEIAKKSGNQAVHVTYLREGSILETDIKPTYSVTDHNYQFGIYVRNFAAGIGTLTFYDPRLNIYGALGHAITDADTNQPLEVGEGRIFESRITSVDKGQVGDPGEKRGIFVNEHKMIGDISKNTIFGIFGKMHSLPLGDDNKALPIAKPHQVKKGEAEILTVVKDNKVERFKIEIVDVSLQKAMATKGLVIKITDPKLLSKTGGIVQGMSGSPIIQDGMIVGAVTHVLVNDPTSGYGTYIEWMLQNTELSNSSQE